jgi:hypothetical protein
MASEHGFLLSSPFAGRSDPPRVLPTWIAVSRSYVQSVKDVARLVALESHFKYKHCTME